MYIAAVRIADEFGCDAIGIQYQQGLKDIAPASDLVEGLLNNVDRPPVFDAAGKELYRRPPLPHFNEVDECAGWMLIVTNRIWTAMRLDPATTLHDVRWGEQYKDEGIDDSSGSSRSPAPSPHPTSPAVTPGASSERQPPMYFRLGGGTLKGVCKPGPVVWSRVFSRGWQAPRRHRPRHRHGTSRRRDRAPPGKPSPRSGPSCTSCCTASRAISSWRAIPQTTSTSPMHRNRRAGRPAHSPPKPP